MNTEALPRWKTNPKLKKQASLIRAARPGKCLGFPTTCLRVAMADADSAPMHASANLGNRFPGPLL